MDVYHMYIGDSASYSSMRNPMFRDYEKFPYGSFESSLNCTTKNYFNKVQEKKQKTQQNIKKKSSKDSCPFCKEQKKRPLVAYLRKRELSKGDDKICEENEHEEEEEEHEHNHTETEQPKQ